jgi:hypothetical protein
VSPPNLPAPSLPNFQAGYQPAGPDFYGWWYLNAAFFQQRVVFRAVQSSTTTPIPADGSPYVVGIDTVEEDPWGGFDASTHEWSVPVGVTGQYRLTGTVFTQPLAVGAMLVPALGGNGLDLARGACIPAGAAHNAGAQGCWTQYLLPGQEVCLTATRCPAQAPSTRSTPPASSQVSRSCG